MFCAFVPISSISNQENLAFLDAISDSVNNVIMASWFLNISAVNVTSFQMILLSPLYVYSTFWSKIYHLFFLLQVCCFLAPRCVKLFMLILHTKILLCLLCGRASLKCDIFKITLQELYKMWAHFNKLLPSYPFFLTTFPAWDESLKMPLLHWLFIS